MNVQERFLKYITYDTRADAVTGEKGAIPSSPGQTVFAGALYEEIKSLGITDVTMDEKSFVYGGIPSNIEGEAQPPTVGFIAHIDTATNFPGPGDSWRVITDYDGSIIELGGGIFLDPAENPALMDAAGDDLVVTNGETLLGGDDKAGVAEIMTAIEYLMTHPEMKHGQVAFAFTPDEEIGGSMRNFDLDQFQADFAYTLDGEEFGTLEYENICNSAVVLEIEGVSAHPGYAKNQMKHALNIANEFHSHLPAWERAEHTEGYEGFYHLVQMEGNPKHCRTAYLIKDFEEDGLAAKEQRVRDIADLLNKTYGEGTISLEFIEGKKNMASIIEEHMELIDYAKEAIRSCGTEPIIAPLRGGTDGVALSFRGLPCPNLGTGAYNHHALTEFANVQKMEKCKDMILKLIEIFAR